MDTFRKCVLQLSHLAWNCLLLLLLQGATVLTGSRLCTKQVAVPVPGEAQMTRVLQRVPSPCSNWDKSWAWLTKVDCSTKYGFVYIPVHPVKYQLQYTCCDNDTKCKEEAKRQATPEFNSADDKFLAIILGSTAAAILILIVIITISVCHRRRQLSCSAICSDKSHIYESADDLDEATQLQSSRDGDMCGDETGNKVCCDAEYEEIGDGRRVYGSPDNLPRYTDIFKEKERFSQELSLESYNTDPFKEASAPPLKHDDVLPSLPPRIREFACHVKSSDIKELLHGSAEIIPHEEGHYQMNNTERVETDKTYYNSSGVKGSKSDLGTPEAVGASRDVEAREGRHEELPLTVVYKVSSSGGVEGGPSGANSSACSIYDNVGNSLIIPDPSQEYEYLVDINVATSEDSVQASNSQALKAMNGHLETANC